MRAKHNGPELAVTSHALQAVLVLTLQRIPKLSKKVPKERRVRNNSDTFLRPRVQPLQKLDRPRTALLITLPLIAVENIFIVVHVRKVKLGKLGGNLADRPPPIADVVPPPLATLLLDEDPGRGHRNPREMLRRPCGRHARVEEGGRPRRTGAPEDVQRRLARARQRRDDDEVECGEGAAAARAARKDVAQLRRLGDALGRETGVVEGVVGSGRVAAEEAAIVARLLGRDVVLALGVADEVNFLGSAGEEDGEARRRRAEAVLEAVVEHRLGDGLGLDVGHLFRHGGDGYRGKGGTLGRASCGEE